MDQPATIWDDVWRVVVTSATVAAAAWGAAGGATSALAITGQSRRGIMRQVALGALTAGGLGSAAGAVLGGWLHLGSDAIAAATAGGSVSGAASYMTGVFGPALFEVILSRIRAGRLPGDQ